MWIIFSQGMKSVITTPSFVKEGRGEFKYVTRYEKFPSRTETAHLLDSPPKGRSLEE